MFHRKLVYLDLSHNGLEQTTWMYLEGLTALETLNLEHNGLNHIHKDAFKDLTKLTYLNLG